MSDKIDTIIMEHTVPVAGGVPVLHSEPKPDPKPEPKPEQEVTVTTTVKPAEPEKPRE